MENELVDKLRSENITLESGIANSEKHLANLKESINRVKNSRAYSYIKMIKNLSRLVKFVQLKPTKIKKGIIFLMKKGPKKFIRKIFLMDQSRQHSLTLEEQYRKWLATNYPQKSLISTQTVSWEKFKIKPLISIIMPTYNSKLAYLEEVIESVRCQSYSNWELCIADDASENMDMMEMLKKYQNLDDRIKVKIRPQNGHICEASNTALSLAKGEFIALLDHDDLLWPNALYEIVGAINNYPQSKFLYSDEDKISADGKLHFDPFFKPDWSPEFLRSVNYITHFAVIQRDLVNSVGGFKEGFEGAQDWDLFLRTTLCLTDKEIIHIPKILYSWRAHETSSASKEGVSSVKKYAIEVQKKVLEEDMKARNVRGEVNKTKYLGVWSCNMRLDTTPLVSVVIPTKNCLPELKECVNSIITKTTYLNWELVIVDTGSTSDEVWNYYDYLTESSKLKLQILEWKKEFNFSSVINYGVKHAKGEYVVLLNNDTQILTASWIEKMLSYSIQKDIGAVGCKLLYPDYKIQHAGIILGIKGGVTDKGVAGHAFKNFPSEIDGLRNIMLNSVRNYSAVTAACLMIKKSKYDEVEGFDPAFRIAFNDVDFCLKLRRKYRNIYLPDVEVLHKESISVGRPDEGTRDVYEFNNEQDMMHKKWHGLLQNDPYYNPNLSLENESFEINLRTSK